MPSLIPKEDKLYFVIFEDNEEVIANYMTWKEANRLVSAANHARKYIPSIRCKVIKLSVQDYHKPKWARNKAIGGY